MASTLIEQLRTTVRDVELVGADTVSMTPQYLATIVTALEHRDATIQAQYDQRQALTIKLKGILDNDTALVPTKIQLLRRALGMPVQS